MSDLIQEEKDILGALGLLALFVVSIVGGIPAWGLCYQHVWNWYAPIISSNLPLLTFKGAMAASLLVSLFKLRLSVAEKTATDNIKQDGNIEGAKQLMQLSVSHNIMTPFVVLGINWLIHLMVFA
jgi:hypothetical protein